MKRSDEINDLHFDLSVWHTQENNKWRFILTRFSHLGRILLSILPFIRIPLEQTSLSIYKMNILPTQREDDSELLCNQPLLLLLGKTSHSKQKRANGKKPSKQLVSRLQCNLLFVKLLKLNNFYFYFCFRKDPCIDQLFSSSLYLLVSSDPRIYNSSGR